MPDVFTVFLNKEEDEDDADDAAAADDDNDNVGLITWQF